MSSCRSLLSICVEWYDFTSKICLGFDFWYEKSENFSSDFKKYIQPFEKLIYANDRYLNNFVIRYSMYSTTQPMTWYIIRNNNYIFNHILFINYNIVVYTYILFYYFATIQMYKTNVMKFYSCYGFPEFSKKCSRRMHAMLRFFCKIQK